jgi:lipid-A-disaccharide synthase
MIVAGNHSSDFHGANLIHAIKKRRPDLHFFGVGGKELSAAGVNLLFNSGEGESERPLTILPDILSTPSIRRQLKKKLQSDHPCLLVLTEFCKTNVMLAEFARKMQIPVFYCMDPQSWTRRSGKSNALERLADRVGVVLPIEEQCYQKKRVLAHYIGCPFIDTIKKTMDKNAFCHRYEIDSDHKIVGLCPEGSKKEMSVLLPAFLEAAKRMQKKYQKHIVFLMFQKSGTSDDDFDANGLKDYRQDVDIRIICQNRYDMMAACDAAITTPGPVSLELAILNVPMVIVRQISPFIYYIQELFNKNEYISLVNLIADAPVVPELLQDQIDPGSIEVELAFLLFDEPTRQKLQEGLATVREKLGGPGAYENAAEFALELVEKKQD